MFFEGGLARNGSGNVGASASQKRDWQQRLTVDRPEPSDDATLEIRMASAGLDDEGMLAWSFWFDKQLEALGAPPHLRAAEIDFSGNKIGLYGTSALCAVLEKHAVHCDVLRLDGNYLDDAALRDVTRYMTTSHKAPVQELSMGRNCFSAKGVAWLLMGLAMHPAYPAWHDEAKSYRPLRLLIGESETTDDGELVDALMEISSSCHLSVVVGDEEKLVATTPSTKSNCVAHLCSWSLPEGYQLPSKAPYARPIFGASMVEDNGFGEADQRMQPCVMFEDDHLAVVYKPAGWTCSGDWDTNGGICSIDLKNPPAEEEREEKLSELIQQQESACIKSWLFLNFGYDEGSEAVRDPLSEHGLVHRLDVGTSGPVIIGKTIEAFEYAKQQIRDRDVVKDYLALVHGSFDELHGVCRFPIDRSQYRETKKVRVHESGAPAVTIWEAMAEYESGDSYKDRYTLMHFRLITGRTHQIRVHMAHLGHPIMSDWTYVEDKEAAWRDSMRCTRIFLHKFRVSFMDMEGFPVSVSCPLRMDPKLWITLENMRLVGGMALNNCAAPGLRGNAPKRKRR